MAWPNIDERRDKVQKLMSEGATERYIRRTCSIEFGCTESAIMQDIHFFNGNVAHIGSSTRKRIRIRDRYTCQYCGIEHPKSGIIEHIIPFALGGCAKDYNLVFACQRCNCEKKRAVWIPDNLEAITKDNPEWREKIISMIKKINSEK